ncbi:MAG: fatty acid synthase subunit beta domain-containing protein, partial [Microthrixaceae bacterium]
LDEVAGDEEAVAERREEIVDALARTAKPYFGEVAEMTYLEILERFADLVAIGSGSRYEDGCWLDPTHRGAFVDLLGRCEARLSPVEEGSVPTRFADPRSVDDPANAIETLLEDHPVAADTLVHPADVDWFESLCARPGKPMPFVSRIDADVRRRYQSDSLWQAHSERFDADQTLVIPGPLSLAGIDRTDEPVADLLDRFEAGVVDQLTSDRSRRTGRTDSTVAPFRLLGPRSGGTPALAAVRSARSWFTDGRARSNPLTALDPGGFALTERDHGVVGLALDLGDAPGGHSSISFELAVRSHAGTPVVELDGASLHDLASALTSVGSEVPSDAHDHSLLVGGAVALPDRWVGAAWPQIFSSIASRHGEAILDLLHASHRVEVLDPVLLLPRAAGSDSVGRITGDRVSVEVRAQDRAHGSGTMFATRSLVSVEGRPAAVLHDEFLLRGHFRAAEPTGAGAAEPTTSAPGAVGTPVRTLGSQVFRAPVDLERFAEVTGDPNPIHRSDVFARFCGLPGRIVHGMWTSALAQRVTVDEAADGDVTRLTDWDISFTDAVSPGAEVEVRVERVAVERGARLLRIVVTADEATVAVASATVAAPRTAYVFPGQGVQSVGMGMDGYERSERSREVWDRADAHCRRVLGFSVLEVVRENPTNLRCGDTTYRHPAGVLFLTQFTQVAMATLACAQVAELDELGVLDPAAVCAGHSVGEYNALAALGDVLALENLIELVFARGLAMHHLVPRDDAGNSQYRLAAVRPHLAGIDHATVEALVEEVALDTGELCEVVNHNLRGKQYAVAGTVASLEVFAQRLRAAGRGVQSGGRDPLLMIPGIDVPFHSSALAGGVAEFRSHLEANVPTDADFASLEGRYVPNLYPVPLRIDREYVAAVDELLDGRSEQLVELLEHWHSTDARRAGRILLIELLAWQFASPVRWIETTELLCTPRTDGGLGVQRIIEVGVGSQPTLTNLTKGALALEGHRGLRPEVLHVELDVAAVTETDRDPEPVVADGPDEDEADGPGEEESTGEALQPPTAAAPEPPPAPGEVPSVQTPDQPVGAALAVRVLVALRAGVRLDQLGGDSIDDLVDGASS